MADRCQSQYAARYLTIELGSVLVQDNWTIH